MADCGAALPGGSESGARASAAGARANVAAHAVLLDLARRAWRRGETNQLAAGTVGRRGFCAGAVGAGGGDAEFIGGKITAGQAASGAGAGTDCSTRKFL